MLVIGKHNNLKPLLLPSHSSSSPASADNNEQSIILPQAKPLDPNEWLLFLRFQKTGSKGWTELLKAIGKAQQDSKRKCEHGFFTSISPVAKKKRCTIYDDCATQLSKFLLKQGDSFDCQVIADQHCDYNDLSKPFQVGHLAQARFDATYRVVTILRDPIKRTVSEWKHVVLQPQGVWDYCVREFTKKSYRILSRENFLKYLNSDNTAYGMRNRQTRMMGSTGSAAQTTRNMYTRALDLLNHEETVVGTMELLDESVRLIRYAFGVDQHDRRFQFNTKRETADKKKPQFDIMTDESLKNQVKQLNEFDVKLHARATSLVSTRIELLSKRVYT